ncbi:MAG: Cobalt transport protein CbiM [Verrucomicrobiae bacterium]|nr:Cobalt transport protein CbiM [Verrucomicrobiae bacterium]
MHIPDGFLDGKTAAASAVLAAGGLAVALRQVHRHLPRERVPLLGLSAAFVFAAQMLNFPVAGGTSGHLIGSVLTAVLLGPSAAVIVITSVLVVQCFLFADGGVLALGANIFLMAIVSNLSGYAVYRLVHGWSHSVRSTVLAAAFAGWCGTVLAAICCAGQLALSGTVPWTTAFPAMTGVHMLIGLGEGLITGLVIAVIARARPDLLDQPAAGNLTPVLGYGLLLALGLAIFVAPFASPWPDGLEKVAATLGFEHRAVAEPVLPAPLPDYEMPGIQSAVAATAVAGAVGTFIVFGLAAILARVLVPKSR